MVLCDSLLIAKTRSNRWSLEYLRRWLESCLGPAVLIAGWGDGGRQYLVVKRRIGIARAILRDNPPILLLDEPTEGLDKQTVQHHGTCSRSTSKARPVIFITHRYDWFRIDGFYRSDWTRARLLKTALAKLLSEEGRYFNFVRQSS